MHETLDKFSWLDRFVISENLQQLLLKSEIIDGGENISNELSVTYIRSMRTHASFRYKPAIKDRWDKAYLLTYFNTTSYYYNINIPK